jgi:hypothetical protein
MDCCFRIQRFVFCFGCLAIHCSDVVVLWHY